MLRSDTERKWFSSTIIFLVLYCTFLFFFRSALFNVEAQRGDLLKPEPGQIMAIGILILIYHFTFLGLYAFSALGRWQKAAAIVVSLIVTGSLLYGFKQWYHAVVNNPFLSFHQVTNLPWYAKEDIKFLMANTPLILFFVTVFLLRMLPMQGYLQRNKTDSN